MFPGEGNGIPLQYSCLENPMARGAWWAAVHGVAKSWTRLSDFTFTFHFHALEKEMATHSSVFAWRIPGTGEPGGLPSMGSHRVGHDWWDLAAVAAATIMLIEFLTWHTMYPISWIHWIHFIDFPSWNNFIATELFHNTYSPKLDFVFVSNLSQVSQNLNKWNPEHSDSGFRICLICFHLTEKRLQSEEKIHNVRY